MGEANGPPLKREAGIKCTLCCKISLQLFKDSSLVVITWQLFHLSGVIFGFSVKANDSIKKLADKKGIKIKLHNIIYKLIEDLKDELNSRLPPTVVETTIGEFSLTFLPQNVAWSLFLRVCSSCINYFILPCNCFSILLKSMASKKNVFCFYLMPVCYSYGLQLYFFSFRGSFCSWHLLCHNRKKQNSSGWMQSAQGAAGQKNEV